MISLTEYSRSQALRRLMILSIFLAPSVALGQGSLQYVSDRMNFEDALDFCERNGGRMPTIVDRESEVQLRAFMDQFEANITSNGYWVSYKTSPEGVTSWADGTPFDTSLPNWGVIHPQNGECGVWAPNDADMFWWDLPCLNVRPFACLTANEPYRTVNFGSSFNYCTRRELQADWLLDDPPVCLDSGVGVTYFRPVFDFIWREPLPRDTSVSWELRAECDGEPTCLFQVFEASPSDPFRNQTVLYTSTPGEDVLSVPVVNVSAGRLFGIELRAPFQSPRNVSLHLRKMTLTSLNP